MGKNRYRADRKQTPRAERLIVTCIIFPATVMALWMTDICMLRLLQRSTQNSVRTHSSPLSARWYFSSNTLSPAKMSSVKELVDVRIHLLLGNALILTRMTIQNAISQNQVAIFSKTYCPYCAKTKSLFAKSYGGVSPKIYECAFLFPSPPTSNGWLNGDSLQTRRPR